MRSLVGRSVLVTGPAGLAGRAIVSALTAAGATVRLLVHRTPCEVDGAEIASGDLCDSAALCAALDGIDAVVHTAARQSGSEDELIRVNVRGTAALAEAAAASSRVRRFVHLSSATVYATGPLERATEEHPTGSVDAYAATKLAAERAVSEQLGARSTVLRLPSLYRTGPCPIVDFARMLAGMPELPSISEATAIELLHVDDLAATVVLALRSDAEIVAGAASATGSAATFNVTGPEPAPLRAAILAVAGALGKSPNFVARRGDATSDPVWAMLLELAAMPRTLSDARARALLGHRPVRHWNVELPAAALQNPGSGA